MRDRDGQPGREDSRQGDGWRTSLARWQLAEWVRQWLVEWEVPYLLHINWEEQLRARQTIQARVPTWGNKDSNPLTENTCGAYGNGRNSQHHGRVLRRDPQGSRAYINPPTQDSAPEEPNLLVGSRGND